ncbi:uncharacterized protein EAF02_002380 [Botrytis sinoallii]|uniref:uncharacterized protein n=1 Tax=Botrytis sinoallii TaxID=1463999 RepID=UPI0019010C85|nr:uncharacterized protein EAF02_002380 [Botrytis sinoallii]KAF7889965.1 hypothetical protein EAF02_002380 [Botrytis sinoallii]
MTFQLTSQIDGHSPALSSPHPKATITLTNSTPQTHNTETSSPHLSSQQKSTQHNSPSPNLPPNLTNSFTLQHSKSAYLIPPTPT